MKRIISVAVLAALVTTTFHCCAPKTADVSTLPIKYVLSSDAPSDSTDLKVQEDGTVLFSIPVGYIPKGGVVDFNVSVNTSPECSKYYVTEFRAGKTWYPGDIFMASGNGEHPSVVMQTFRMPEGIKDMLEIRFRPTGREKADTSAREGLRPRMELRSKGYVGEYVQYFGEDLPKDTLNVLCIGNSFTYFSSAPSFLKEIAWNEGHFIRVKASLKGGQTFGQHMGLPLSRYAMSVGKFDYAFLQDQSQAAANFAKDSASFSYVNADFQRVVTNVVARSPKCHLVLEDTWAYEASDFSGFGSMDEFDRLMADGTSRLVRNAELAFPGNTFEVSPIAQAFKMVRDGDSGIELYTDDSKHQSIYGSYLKACVNYLMIFGSRFQSVPSPDSKTSVDCGLPHDKAEYLRHVAEQVMGL